MRARIEYDEDEFRRLWAEGIPASAIAVHFGASRQDWAYGKANLMGLPNRRQVKAAANDAEIRRLWTTDLLIRDIAAELGMTKEAVKWRAHVLELPNRREARKYGFSKPEYDPKPAKPAPVMRKCPHPNWPVMLDLKVFATAGKYAAIAELAKETGRPIAAIQGRWHLIGGR